MPKLAENFYIGIFWIYNSQIYLKSIDKNEIKAINCFIDSDFSHYKTWDDISLQHKDFYLYEYEDIPRGRVVYSVEKQIVIIYANDNIVISDEARSLIIDRFKLKTKKVIFKYDEHYGILNKK